MLALTGRVPDVPHRSTDRNRRPAHRAAALRTRPGGLSGQPNANLLPVSHPFLCPAFMNRPIRNIAIIAHVEPRQDDAGGLLLKQSGTFAAHEKVGERVMDSTTSSVSVAFTILAKKVRHRVRRHNASISSITPGNMRNFWRRGRARAIDGRLGLLLLVDASKGRCPIDAFRHAQGLALGPQGHCRRQQIDRPAHVPGWVVDQRPSSSIDKSEPTYAQLDFPSFYASALQGWSSTDLNRTPSGHERIVRVRSSRTAAAANGDRSAAATADPQPLLRTLCRSHWSSAHPPRSVRPGQVVVSSSAPRIRARRDTGRCSHYMGLERVSVDEAFGRGYLRHYGGRGCKHRAYRLRPEGAPRPARPYAWMKPTIAMNFQVNTSPLAGREGKFVTRPPAARAPVPRAAEQCRAACRRHG